VFTNTNVILVMNYGHPRF